MTLVGRKVLNVRLWAISSLLLLVSSVAFGQHLPEPRLLSAGLPRYPPIARQARIQGEVRVDFILNQNGEPVSVTAVSGHPMLKPAAEENVRTWRFELPKNLFRTEWTYSTTFNFKIADDGQPYENAKLTVVLDSYRYVEVITNPPSTKYAHDCPEPNEIEVPQAIRTADFVELSRSGCYGTCPAYKVRIDSDGHVSWSGNSFVDVVGERRSTIPPAAAEALLKQFQTERFWALCGGYGAGVTDSATTQIQARVGGRGKTVWNYASSAPEWVESLENAVDEAANTHQWRHGEASTEPLSNIFQDGYMPKLGVTDLMRAAAKADVEAIKRILATGADVDATDSSGWTALMYAAANEHSEPVELLLTSGANPNHKSLNGDTPIMASAIARSFSEPLFHAGADLNAQNVTGMTALMILAAEGETDEVKAALEAGARATLRDSRGRTALDYLHLANCGKSPVPDYQFSSGGKCDHLDNDNVRDVAALLKGASRNPKP